MIALAQLSKNRRANKLNHLRFLSENACVNKQRYEHRINRVIALIDRQIDQDLSIERLAEEANFSPFHFHRIFSALTGESVHAMTTRIRMQRALVLTRRGARPQWKAVSAAVGYRSPDAFSRAFKRHFGCTPSQFDLEQWWLRRPDRDTALGVSSFFLRPAPLLPRDFRVEIEPRPATSLIVSRATGAYLRPESMIDAYDRICEASRSLELEMPGRLSGASQDDPELVPLSRCRYDFSLEVSDSTKVPKGLHRARRAEGLWATVRVNGDFQAVDRAWNLLFKSWLPESGLNLRNVSAEEIYHQTPNEIGWDHFDLTLAIPVEAG